MRGGIGGVARFSATMEPSIASGVLEGCDLGKEVFWKVEARMRGVRDQCAPTHVASGDLAAEADKMRAEVGGGT